jgi:hypothetical protein
LIRESWSYEYPCGGVEALVVVAATSFFVAPTLVPQLVAPIPSVRASAKRMFAKPEWLAVEVAGVGVMSRL